MQNTELKRLYVDGFVMFTGTLLFAFLYIAMWAWLFTGVWYNSHIEQDLPAILQLSVIVTFILFVSRTYKDSQASSRVITGLSLFVLFLLVVMPLDKYFYEFPDYAVSSFAYLPLSTLAVINFSLIYSGLRTLTRAKKEEEL